MEGSYLKPFERKDSSSPYPVSAGAVVTTPAARISRQKRTVYKKKTATTNPTRAFQVEDAICDYDVLTSGIHTMCQVFLVMEITNDSAALDGRLPPNPAFLFSYIDEKPDGSNMENRMYPVEMYLDLLQYTPLEQAKMISSVLGMREGFEPNVAVGAPVAGAPPYENFPPITYDEPGAAAGAAIDLGPAHRALTAGSTDTVVLPMPGAMANKDIFVAGLDTAPRYTLSFQNAPLSNCPVVGCDALNGTTGGAGIPQISLSNHYMIIKGEIYSDAVFQRIKAGLQNSMPVMRTTSWARQILPFNSPVGGVESADLQLTGLTGQCASLDIVHNFATSDATTRHNAWSSGWGCTSPGSTLTNVPAWQPIDSQQLNLPSGDPYNYHQEEQFVQLLKNWDPQRAIPKGVFDANKNYVKYNFSSNIESTVRQGAKHGHIDLGVSGKVYSYRFKPSASIGALYAGQGETYPPLNVTVYARMYSELSVRDGTLKLTKLNPKNEDYA